MAMKPHIFRFGCGQWAVRARGRVHYFGSFGEACGYAKIVHVA
jgi:hypothetical protein